MMCQINSTQIKSNQQHMQTTSLAEEKQKKICPKETEIAKKCFLNSGFCFCRVCHLDPVMILCKMTKLLSSLSGLDLYQEICLLFRKFGAVCIEVNVIFLLYWLCWVQLFVKISYTSWYLLLTNICLFLVSDFTDLIFAFVCICLSLGRTCLIFHHIQTILPLTQMPWSHWIFFGVWAELISNLLLHFQWSQFFYFFPLGWCLV